MKTETKPRGAFEMSATVEFGDNGDGAASVPLRIVARTRSAIESFWWGKVYHDLEGMHRKSRIPVDYVHSDLEVLGYLNKDELTERGLEGSGALVPFGAPDADRTAEVIHKQKAGVPYQASIFWGSEEAGDTEIQLLRDGETAMVNGELVRGEATIVRKWPWRGCAICPYGADGNTSTKFAAGKEFSVSILEDSDMADETTEAPEAVEVDETQEEEAQEPEAPEAVEGDAQEPEGDDPPPADPEDEGGEEEPGEEEGTPDEEEPDAPEGEDGELRAEVRPYVDALGHEDGLHAYAHGLTIEAALQAKVDRLASENESLEGRLDAVDIGEAEPVTPGEAPPADPKEEMEARVYGTALTALAAKIRRDGVAKENQDRE